MLQTVIIVTKSGKLSSFYKSSIWKKYLEEVPFTSSRAAARNAPFDFRIKSLK